MEFKLRPHLVVLLDILGHKGHLSALEKAVNTDNAEAVRRAVESSLTVVADLREKFKVTLSALEGRLRPPRGASTDQRDFFNRLGPLDLPFQAYADSLVVCVPVDDTDAWARGALAALLATCVVFLYSLKAGYPIRGAVEVGCATSDLFPGEIYGPALCIAHMLESSKADFPRVIIGAELWGRLRSIADERVSDREGEFYRDCAKKALDLVGDDVDGCRILDYLGEMSRQQCSGIAGEWLPAAHRFLKVEHRRFAAAGDFKLARRYYLALRYFSAKSSAWTGTQ